MRDPMLNAAAEALRDHPDHMRWMGYADDEMQRLRDRLGLPTPTGYAQGKPNYPTASSKAQAIREEIERRTFHLFSPRDSAAVERVLEEIIAEHREARQP